MSVTGLIYAIYVKVVYKTAKEIYNMDTMDNMQKAVV